MAFFNKMSLFLFNKYLFFNLFAFFALCDEDDFDLPIKLLYQDFNCEGIASQHRYDLELMTGKWYGLEILEFVEPTKFAPGICIEIDIKVNTSDSKPVVTFTWNEPNLKVEYTFLIMEADKKGEWSSNSYQTVTPIVPSFNHFSGKVFVIKIVQEEAILTFCIPNKKLYTLMLSRSRSMDKKRLDINRGLAARRIPYRGSYDYNVVPVQIKKYCVNASSGDIWPYKWIFCFVILAYSLFANK